MASPQTENGYFKVANELAEALYLFPFSGQQFRIMMWVMRDTYGWRRKETNPRTLGELSSIIQIPKSTLSWAIKQLVDGGVLIRSSKFTFSLNKNYDEWLVQGSGMLPLLSNQLDVQPIERPFNGLGSSASPIRNLKTIKKDNVGRPSAFTPPTIEEVRAYCIERKNLVDTEKFFHHYESNGWKVGKNPMKNWKSSVCFWERTTFDSKGAMKPAGKVCPLCEVQPLPYPNAIVCEKCGARCRKCNDATALLKIVVRADKTRTVHCTAKCARVESQVQIQLPQATKDMNEAARARFLERHERYKKTPKEKS